MPSRVAVVMAGVLVTLAIVVPASAQGKGGGKKSGKNPSPPPSTSALTAPTATSASSDAAVDPAPVTTTVAPFAWLDDASVLAPGSVWLGVSMVHWRGSGSSQTIVPVMDGAIGLAPRVQLGASVPRVAGGLGTTFFSGKIVALEDAARGLSVAVGPTLEIEPAGATDVTSAGEGRAHWGLPVSIQVDRENTRIYGSSGYFSPGIWYAGAGAARTVVNRVGVSVSFSRAWTTSSSLDPTATGSGRNELSGGASFELKPNVAVFGSIGRTIATPEGAGTTLSFGLSLSAAGITLTK